MLLADELESITFRGWTTQALGHTTPLLFLRAFVCWATKSIRNSYSSSISTRHLLSSCSRAYLRITANSFARCVPPLYPSAVINLLLCSQHSEPLLLLQHHLFSLFFKTLSELHFPACPLRYPCCLPLARAILLQARDGGQVILISFINLLMARCR
jgi:hypothetical protein